ncbi:MAG: hypothetical protein HKN09_08365, partial [Saprospiraceae bacterium]|nr:hypothetical protein [Saprospiraceae bacterium]
DEIGYFEPDNNGILRFNSIKERIPEKYRSLEDVWDIEVIDSTVYFRSVNKIYSINPASTDVYDPEQSIDFLKKCGSELYFNCAKTGLFTINEGEPKFVENSQLFIDKLIVSVVQLDNQLVVFTSDDGIYVNKDSRFQPWNNTINQFFSNKEIITAELTADQHIAIGTALHGIFLFNSNGLAIQQLDKKSGLQNNNILSVFSEDEGGIWIGSSNGIDYIINNNKRYIFPDGEQEGGIYDIAVHNDQIYFATNNGLYFCKWKSTYDPLSFEGFKSVEQSSGQVWGLDTIGNTLFMGHNEGGYIIEENKAKKITQDAGYWRFIGVDNNTKVIAGGYNGLSLFERINDEWRFIRRFEGFSESSRFIVKENEKRFWVAHPYRGIFQINFNETYDSIYVRKYTEKDGLPSMLRNHVFLVDGLPVFAGESNIYRYNNESDSFSIDKDFEALLGSKDRVLRIFQDPEKRIWYLTENDFGYFEKDKNLLSTQLEKVSLPKLADKFVNGFEALHFVENGHIMLPTESGVIQVLNAGQTNSTIPQAVISRIVLLNHKDSTIYGGYVHSNQSTSPLITGLTKFKYTQNSIRFEFFNAPFSQGEEYQFNPYIEGIDENNSNWTEEAYKEYARLPHGNYTFTLEARNKKGDIGPVSRVDFSVEPPWYQSQLFQSIYVIMFFLFISGLILIPRSKYRKQVRVLKGVQEKSDDEIMQLKNEKLESEINFKNQQLASSMMHLVQKNEVLHKVKKEAERLKKYVNEPQAEKELRKLISLLSNDERLDEDWEKFTYYFDQVHTDFLRRLKSQYPKLSPKDQKLCAYLRMNLTTKDIAPMLNISVRGVEISRYRLRKKLELEGDKNLNDFMMNY